MASFQSLIVAPAVLTCMSLVIIKSAAISNAQHLARVAALLSLTSVPSILGDHPLLRRPL